jgi:hypothetical protein
MHYDLIHSETTNLEAKDFYANPRSHIESIPDRTTHLVLFGDLLSHFSRNETPATIGTILNQQGWRRIWKSSLNGLDILQDEEERRGGVVVFQRTGR